MIKKKRTCSWCHKQKKDTVSLMKVWGSPNSQYVLIEEKSYHTIDCYCCKDCIEKIPVIKEDK